MTTIEVADDLAPALNSLLQHEAGRLAALQTIEKPAPAGDALDPAGRLAREDRPLWRRFCTLRWGRHAPYDHGRHGVDFEVAREELVVGIEQDRVAAAQAAADQTRRAEDLARGLAAWRADVDALVEQLADLDLELARLDAEIGSAKVRRRETSAALAHAREVAGTLTARDEESRVSRVRRAHEQRISDLAWRVAQRTGLGIPDAEAVLRALNADEDRAVAWASRCGGRLLPVDELFDAGD